MTDLTRGEVQRYLGTRLLVTGMQESDTQIRIIRALIAAWDALKEVEWGSTSLARQAGEKITVNHCPGCAGIHPDFEPIDDMEHDDFGHAPDCKLAQALPEE